MPSLEQQVDASASIVGLFLALIALYTSEQVRRLEGQRIRDGGVDPTVVRSVTATTTALTLATVAALASLTPLLWDVVTTCCDGALRPPLVFFCLVWALLLGLVGWQVNILVKSRRASKGARATPTQPASMK
jgi:hypothetical protein